MILETQSVWKARSVDRPREIIRSGRRGPGSRYSGLRDEEVRISIFFDFRTHFSPTPVNEKADRERDGAESQKIPFPHPAGLNTN